MEITKKDKEIGQYVPSGKVRGTRMSGLEKIYACMLVVGQQTDREGIFKYSRG